MNVKKLKVVLTSVNYRRLGLVTILLNESKKVEGSSINGYYTTKVFNFNGKGLNRYSYRLPTSKELWKLKRKAHGENQTSNTSFKKSERNMVEKQYRFREKRKLLNYIKGYTQDVVSEKLPKYPKYFWP